MENERGRGEIPGPVCFVGAPASLRLAAALRRTAAEGAVGSGGGDLGRRPALACATLHDPGGLRSDERVGDVVAGAAFGADGFHGGSAGWCPGAGLVI